MVGAALLEPFEKEAKKRQVESGKEYGRGTKKVGKNFPPGIRLKIQGV